MRKNDLLRNWNRMSEMLQNGWNVETMRKVRLHALKVEGGLQMSTLPEKTSKATKYKKAEEMRNNI